MAQQQQQAQGDISPTRIPLVTNVSNRLNTADIDGRLVNCVAEHAPNSRDYWIYKRPGLTTFLTNVPSDTQALGMYQWEGTLYSVFGNSFYAGSTWIGNVDDTSGAYTFSSTPEGDTGNVAQLFFHNANYVYRYDPVNGIADLHAGAAPDGSFSLTSAAAQTSDTVTVVTADANGNAGPAPTSQTVTTNPDGTVTVTGNATPGYTVTVTFADSTAVSGSANNDGPPPQGLVPGQVYLDGTMYVCVAETATVMGSDLNTLNTWPVDNALAADIEPEPAVAIYKQMVYVVVFKQYSVEFFYDAGNTEASPLAWVPGQKLNMGCMDARTIGQISGVLVWVSRIREGGASIVMMDQLTPVTISTAPIERILQQVDFTTNSIYGFCCKMEGHMLYVLTIVEMNITIVYDITEKLWYEWQDINGNYWNMAFSTGLLNHTYIQGEFTGKIYQLDNTSALDDGLTIVSNVWTPVFDGGTRRKKMISYMRFVGDNLDRACLRVRVTDDDYRTWSDFREVPMGRTPILPRCGTFRRRAWHIQHNMPIPGRFLTAIEPEMELCDL
jgi:hypothetical protein